MAPVKKNARTPKAKPAAVKRQPLIAKTIKKAKHAPVTTNIAAAKGLVKENSRV